MSTSPAGFCTESLKGSSPWLARIWLFRDQLSVNEAFLTGGNAAFGDGLVEPGGLCFFFGILGRLAAISWRIWPTDEPRDGYYRSGRCA